MALAKGSRNLALTLLSALLAVALAGCASSQRRVDVEQLRLDTATPPVYTAEVGQTFVARQDNLRSIEFLLVLYGNADEPAGADEAWAVTLRQDGPGGPVVAEASVPLGGMRHNQVVTIGLGPLTHSHGRTYYVAIRSTGGQRSAVWYNSAEAYADGAMYRDGQPSAGDLRFQTSYDYNPWQALGILASMAWHGWPLALGIAALLIVPGLALALSIGNGQTAEWGEAVLMAVLLTVTTLPLLLLWTTTMGIRLNAVWASAFLVFLALLDVFLLRRLRVRFRAGRMTFALVALAALILAVRFLQTHDLVLPAWVDAVHHTLTTGLIWSQGRVPANYEPAFPGSPFVHHFGFQAVAAWVGWVTALRPERAVLIYGQIANALAALALYPLARRLSGSRVAGLVAAAAIGLLSPMPAYYVSWGRYTQLAGMVALPVAIVTMMDALTTGTRRHLALAVLSAAGLLLTHYRVAVFYAVFCVAYLAWLAWQGRKDRRQLADLGVRMIALTILTLAVTGPWLVRIWQVRLGGLVASPGGFEGQVGQNAMPVPLLDLAGLRPLYLLAGLGLVAGVARRRSGPVLVVAWAGLVYALANVPFGSDRGSWFLPNSALAIAVYLPVGLLIGELAAALWAWRLRLPQRDRVQAVAVALLFIAVAGVQGAWEQLPIVNEQTVLVTNDDMVAMEWIRANTPADSRFLVNAVPWQVGVYRGTDGGWWIPLLTGRQNTLPPVLYKWATKDFRANVDAVAQSVSTGQLPGGDHWPERLSTLGVDYIYIGARGGPLRPEQLLKVPGLRAVYVHGPVWIFAVDEASVPNP